MTELGPGIHDIPSDAYHADPCVTPSLSASIAQLLCTASPAHAHAAHPRLTPVAAAVEKEHFDVGTAVHAMLLEGRDVVQVVNADSWRTKAAKVARSAARLDGKIPLLAHQADQVNLIVDAAREQLASFHAYPPLLEEGKPERTLVWEEDGILCRALVDWLRDDYSAIDDLKTTSALATAESWSRSMFSYGYDVKAAFYLRGLRAITGCDARFRFVVCEKPSPYQVSVFDCGPDVLAVADAKVEFAIRQWRRCLESGVWPGYQKQVCTVELPPWEEQRWMDRESRAEAEGSLL